MSDASKRKEKQKSAFEKPRLDNARKLRGIYFIKDTMKNARRKMEVPMPAAAPCNDRETCSFETSAGQNTLALSKPTRLRESAWKDLFIKIMKTTLLGETLIH